jgi:hypothetical protein
VSLVAGIDTTVAALYVDPDGVYANLPGVEVWDEARDARKYAGPWPVVAHPPCARWGKLAYLAAWKYGYPVGEDDGCFASALEAVRRFGGVLEHPEGSLAWSRFELPAATRGYWNRALDDPGYATEVSQVAYGHDARKRTWLYYVGAALPSMDWGEPAAVALIGGGREERVRVRKSERAATPPGFRDVLLELARLAA